MTVLKLFGVLVAAAGVAALSIVVAPSVSGQERGGRDLMVLAGRGADIGVFVSDTDAGVRVDEVRPGSVAEKAGLQRSDVIVAFDGERVRSARQFTRLVQETAAGRSVPATVERDGHTRDVRIAVPEGRRLDLFGDLADRLPPLNFNFDFDLPELGSGRRLGVTVQDMTDQLAAYFGAKDGVLVTAVTDGSAAARAGVKAGDVITAVAGARVRSRDDLVRALRDAASDDIEIAIVRDRKDLSLKATIEASRRRSRGARL